MSDLQRRRSIARGSGAIMFLRHAVFALLILAIGFVAPARAEGTAGEWVHDLGLRVVQVLRETDGPREKRKQELESIFVESFDIDYIAKFVIGRFWRKASPEQRDEFMKVLPDYVATVAAVLFAGYEGDGFKVTKESPHDGGSYVRGLILRDDGPDVDVAFIISKPSGRYLIKAVSVERISLLVTERSEFGSVLAREGMDGLIARMRKVLNSP